MSSPEFKVGMTDPLLDKLPEITKGRIANPPWTLDKAIASFLRFFPMGFGDPKYIGDWKHGERASRNTPLRCSTLRWDMVRVNVCWSEAVSTGFANYALASIRPPFNLLYRTEIMALRDGLKDQAAATRFFAALFDVLAVSKPDPVRFEQLIDAVGALPFERGKTNPAKWPVLTVFPFVAQPDTFTFLKPRVTKRMAEALNFSLQYRPQLNWRTYENLWRMSNILMDELMKRPERALHPKNWIDLQSFIWVTGRELG